VTDDARGRKVAVVADSRLEELLPELTANGYGTIQLPPAALPPEVRSEWLEQVAEHVAEFVRSGYEVVLAGVGGDAEELSAKLAVLGVAEPLPQYAIQPPSTSRLVPET
jgi:hypothetical protein